MLEATGIYYEGDDNAPILRDVGLHVRPGATVGVIGPNGAGKTTLLRVLTGIAHPSAGGVHLEGRSVHAMGERERARVLAYMSQNPSMGFGFTAQDVVAMGRYAHRRPGASRRRGRAPFDPVVKGAMEATDIVSLRRRPITKLSGGERQRVFLARALAQEPRLLFLDEPTSDLDIRFQLEILQLVRRLQRDQGLTVVMAIHDLTWALRYCDDVLVLHQGRVAASGPAAKIINEAMIDDVFGVRAHVSVNASDPPRVDFVDFVPR